VHQDDPRQLISNSQWAFADCTTTPFPGVPSTTQICLNGGFDTNHIYELIYTAKNPTVLGLGFAAMRDLASFLRNDTSSGNPLRTLFRKQSCTAFRKPAARCAPSSIWALMKMKTTRWSSTG
jgi:hypothetical protein